MADLFEMHRVAANSLASHTGYVSSASVGGRHETEKLERKASLLETRTCLIKELQSPAVTTRVLGRHHGIGNRVHSDVVFM